MKNNGYTIKDLLIVIAILSVSALIILPKVSNALKVNDNKDKIYQEILSTYIKKAEEYGQDNIDEVKKENGIVISIDDLIKEDYIGASTSDGIILDIRDNTTKMNNIKFKLIYDEEKDRVYAEII